MFFSTLLSGAALFQLSIAGYVLQDDYMKDFYSNFDFFTAPDPTNGFVKFVDQSTATQMGMINSTSGTVSWGVDTKTKDASGGRSSIRLTSKKTYNTGLVILDVAHMPTGCGTWPAFWMVGPSWPNNGEIDIIEGVNEQTNNAMTLHTGPGCSISQGGFSGKIATPNCDVKASGQAANAGCSIGSDSSKSYGAGLNSIDGGVYATQWTDSAISVYFFPRSSIPKDITSGSPDPTTWGTPAAKFAGACDIASTFKNQQIVFDTTFCGDWAGEVWSSGSCASKASTCNSFVQNNPSAFTDAYWTINSLKVFSDNGKAEPSSPASPSASKSKAPHSSVVPSKSGVKSAPYPTASPSDAESGVPKPSVKPSGAKSGHHHHSAAPSGTGVAQPSISVLGPGMSIPVSPLPTGTASAEPSLLGVGMSIPVSPTGPQDLVPSATPTGSSGDDSVSGPPGSGPNGHKAKGRPSGTSGGPVAVETVWKTDVVTIIGRAEQTAAPDSKRARHARQHRKMMVQHHARRS